MTARTSFELESGPRPEAMADVPGVGEVTLTRAVVQYRDVHEVELAGGRIADIGLALVLDGRSPAAAEGVDLGSGSLKLLDLGTELVVLDWVYPPTLDHVGNLLEARSLRTDGEGDVDVGGRAGGKELEAYCFDLARHVLGRVGFGPLTRPILLRIGFRDVCRDLDLHEGTSVRLSLSGGGIVRAHLDYDASALLFRTASASRTVELERALEEAFPARDLRRIERVRQSAPMAYQVRFPLPLSLGETRSVVEAMRAGLEQLLACFEPDRFRATQDVLDTLGSRETLAGLRLREPRTESIPLVHGGSRHPPASGTVH